jgi:serine/threonine protein kinase
MLVGKPPFNGETVIDLIVSAATDEPILPSNMAPDCKQLLGHLLAKHPDDRYANGDELAAALESLAKGQGLPPPSGRRNEQDETEGAMTSVDDEPIESNGPQRQARRRVVRRRR